MLKVQPVTNPDGPLDLYYWAAGDPAARPIVLLVGLGMQAIEWPKPFIEELAETRRVICIENRDAGKSPRCGPESEPEAADIWVRRDVAGAEKIVPYDLLDMRDDVLALLERLDITEFDLAGFSMGGMIGQLVAAAVGPRMGKFVQLSSNDGTSHVDSGDDAKRRMMRLFVEPDRPEQVRDFLLEDALAYGAGRLEDTPDLRAEIEEVFERGYSYGGSARHALATLITPDRPELLRSIQAQTLVLHGDQDTCIDPARGAAAADLIPNARFVLIPGVGHIVDDLISEAALNWLLGPETV